MVSYSVVRGVHEFFSPLFFLGTTSGVGQDFEFSLGLSQGKAIFMR